MSDELVIENGAWVEWVSCTGKDRAGRVITTMKSDRRLVLVLGSGPAIDGKSIVIRASRLGRTS